MIWISSTRIALTENGVIQARGFETWQVGNCLLLLPQECLFRAIEVWLGSVKETSFYNWIFQIKSHNFLKGKNKGFRGLFKFHFSLRLLIMIRINGSSFDFKVDEPQNTLLAVYHLLKVMHSVLISNNGCIQVSNHLTPTVSVVNPYTSKFNLL